MPTIYYGSHGIGTCEKYISEFVDFNKMINDILSNEEEIAFMIEISTENNGTLICGFYKNMGVLSHNPQNLLPPYMISFNKEFDIHHPNNEEIVELDYFGESTEFYLKSFIPIKLLLEGIKEFWEYGRLSGKIDWVEV
jgi:hypothetical protein